MSDVNPELINTLTKLFENSILDVIPAVSGVPVFKNNDESNSSSDGAFLGMLPFSGGINGFFMIKTDEQSLKILTSYIMGCDVSAVKENDMMDLIGELTNMICGAVRAKAALNGLHFTLSVPFSVKGINGLEFSFKKNAKTFTMRFSSSGVRINTRVVLS